MISQKSGSFNTTEQELTVTRKFFEDLGCEVFKVEKYKGDRKWGDVMAYTDVGTFLVEVHHESPNRWYKYHQYGFEGPTNTSKSKAEYTMSDIWLFYSFGDGFQMLDGYFFNREAFLDAQYNHGKYFSGYSKNQETGRRDAWLSSVFFVSPQYIQDWEIHNKNELETYTKEGRDYNEISV